MTAPFDRANWRQHLIGAGLVALGFGLFVIGDFLAKELVTDFGTIQVMFGNGIVGCSVLFIYALIRGQIGDCLSSKHFGWHMTRASLFYITGVCNVTALATLSLANFYPIQFTVPIMVAIGGLIFFKDRLGPRHIIGLITGMIGTLIMFQPDLGIMDSGGLLALCGAASFSIGTLMVRNIGLADPPVLFGLTILFGNFFYSAIWLLFDQPNQWMIHDTQALVIQFACGACVGLAFTFVSQGFAMAPAPLAAPMQYTQLIWGILIDIFFYSALPGPATLIAAVIIISGGLFVIWRERRVSGPDHSQSTDTG
jgi:drug/metabolite transporter (DMT)-like permease